MGRNEVAVRGAHHTVVPAAAQLAATGFLDASDGATVAGVSTPLCPFVFHFTRTALALGCVVFLGCGSAEKDASGTTGPAMALADAGESGATDTRAASALDGEGAPIMTAAEMALLGTLSPAVLPPPVPDMSNHWADSQQAAQFGQKLFFDPSFSGKLLDGDNDGSSHTLGVRGDTGKVACAGCHIATAFFLDNRTLGDQISLAAGWGRRRAPSLLDVGQAKSIMWDGRHDALYNQPFGPIESPVEMNSSRLFVAEQVFALHRPDYEAIFGAMPPLGDAARFPQLTAAQTGCQPSSLDTPPTCMGTEHGIPGDAAEFDGMSASDQDAVTQVVVNMGKAIGAYERLLTCGQSRFDQWMHGQPGALSPSEQRGAQTFVGAGKCVNCHSGPFLSDEKFHNVGLQPTTVAVVFIDSDDEGALTGLAASIADPLNVRGKFSDGDDGRLPASVAPSNAGSFRTPILRCASVRPTFMHTGQLATLASVVAFFARGGDSFGFPGQTEIAPLSLSPQDQADLVAFLGALAGSGPAPSLTVTP